MTIYYRKQQRRQRREMKKENNRPIRKDEEEIRTIRSYKMPQQTFTGPLRRRGNVTSYQHHDLQTHRQHTALDRETYLPTNSNYCQFMLYYIHTISID